MDKPKRYGLRSLLNPEPDPSPNWFRYLVEQGAIPPPSRPNPFKTLARDLSYPFSNAKDELKLAVWLKASPVDGYDPALIRMDREGNLMCFSDHGNCDSAIGWQIDHIFPKSKGGSDHISNLQPLNWRTNQRKKDKVIAPPVPVLRRPLG